MWKRMGIAGLLCLGLFVLSGCRSEIDVRQRFACGETHAEISIDLAWVWPLDLDGGE